MKTIIFILVFLLLASGAYASTCTLELDNSEYVQEGISTATMICSDPSEKSITGTVNWTNASGYVVLSTPITTPSVKNTFFFTTYTINDSYIANFGSVLNANLSDPTLVLEGTDNATIAVATSSNLLITDISLSPTYFIGKFGAIKYKVTDNTGSPIFNAQCIVNIVDGNDLPVIASAFPSPSQSDGYILKSAEIHYFWKEDESFKWDIVCGCLNSTGLTSANTGYCIDTSDGSRIMGFAGVAIQQPFTISTYLNVNTVVDGTVFEMKDRIYICANVTNVESEYRIPLEIEYQARCSADVDNDEDLDRSLIIETDHINLRGINVGTTQMQCHDFILPEIDHLQGRNSECYASTNVWVLGGDGKRVIGYVTTSKTFNITSDELNLDPDWALISKGTLNSIINLSSWKDINGSGTGNIDIRLDFSEYDIDDAIGALNLIKNVTIWDESTQLIEHTHWELEYLEDGNLEIELKDVSLLKVDGWWNITLVFNDFEERSTTAFESLSENTSNIADNTSLLATEAENQSIYLGEIANKTGTFQLIMDCPAKGTFDDPFRCVVKARVEREQVVQKEVDFTCYLKDSEGVRYSSMNFNKMITNANTEIPVEFTIPKSFKEGIEYQAFCEAGYYNLGSRTDTFYDTFKAENKVSMAAKSTYQTATDKYGTELSIFALITLGIFTVFIVKPTSSSKVLIAEKEGEIEQLKQNLGYDNSQEDLILTSQIEDLQGEIEDLGR